DTIIDYRMGTFTGDYPPRIKSLAPDRPIVHAGDTVRLYCTATDRNNDSLAYLWLASGGTILGGGAVVRWISPDSEGMYLIDCRVSDGRGGADSASVTINSAQTSNHPPNILRLYARPRK